MSTRKKECVSSVREKRGTSPSPSPSHLRSSPKPSKTSTSRSLDSSPSSDKTTPNYLKPTLSSSLASADATKLQGRLLVSNTDSALKSNLARRRSFDKPPSPTRTLKTRGVSPNPSFSGKTGSCRAVTSPKSDRSLKGTRDAGKQQHLYARAVGTLKKSATMGSKTKKAETATASSRKKDAADLLESSIAEDEEDSVVADQELDEDTLLEDESHKADSPTVSEQPDADSDDAAEVELSPKMLEHCDARIGKAESPTICGESDGNVPKAESLTLSGQDGTDGANDADNEVQDAAEAAKVESPVHSEQRVESPTVPEQAEEISSSEPQEVEENSTNPDQSVAGNADEDKAGDKGEAEEEKAVDTKPEGEAGEVVEDGDAAPRLSHGKKDVALSNNVIEEMTREQRRNKVRALAGAFETVISLQEHK